MTDIHEAVLLSEAGLLWFWVGPNGQGYRQWKVYDDWKAPENWMPTPSSDTYFEAGDFAVRLEQSA